jgi:2-phospho-L-lactate/phosphoenolpyruvate guanylyltransferase
MISMDGADLVVPVKRLAAAKTRLRGVAPDAAAHTRLALALTRDTITAARAAVLVRTVVVVTADRTVAAALTALGVDVVDDPLAGLNAAYDRGAGVLRSRDPRSRVAALQADLPALDPAQLDEALAAAAALGGRAFCADAEGTGTTLLVAAPGVELDPRFGGGSAARHRASGARALLGYWPGLRRDVDTAADLRRAVRLGVGTATRAALAPVPFPGAAEFTGHFPPGPAHPPAR